VSIWFWSFAWSFAKRQRLGIKRLIKSGSNESITADIFIKIRWLGSNKY